MTMAVRTTRRRPRRRSENVWKPFVRPKNDERKSIGKWKKNEKRCVKKFEIK